MYGDGATDIGRGVIGAEFSGVGAKELFCLGVIGVEKLNSRSTSPILIDMI